MISCEARLPPLRFSTCFVFSLLVSTSAFAQERPTPEKNATPPSSTAKDKEDPPVFKPRQPRDLTEEESDKLQKLEEKPPLHEDFTWRFGPTFHAMFDSFQGRPFAYPGIGFRKKSPTFYFDLHIPLLMGGIDGLLYLFQQQLLRSSNAVNLFETLNQPRQYVFFEATHLKIGPSWRRIVGEKSGRPRPIDLSAGVVGVADFVVFDAKLLGMPIPDDANINDIVQRDPIVLGLGLFGAVGANRGPASADIALEVARDLFNWQAYTPAPGWVISADLDTQLQIVDDLAMSARGRLSTYTHVPGERIFSFSVTTGISFRF